MPLGPCLNSVYLAAQNCLLNRFQIVNVMLHCLHCKMTCLEKKVFEGEIAWVEGSQRDLHLGMACRVNPTSLTCRSCVSSKTEKMLDSSGFHSE